METEKTARQRGEKRTLDILETLELCASLQLYVIMKVKGSIFLSYPYHHPPAVAYTHQSEMYEYIERGKKDQYIIGEDTILFIYP